MPFGDHVQTYSARVSRADFDPQRPIPARPVQVPDVDPPVWWSEYLLAKWKRKNHLEKRPPSLSPGRAAEQRYQRECAHVDALRSFEKVHALRVHPIWGPRQTVRGFANEEEYAL